MSRAAPTVDGATYGGGKYVQLSVRFHPNRRTFRAAKRGGLAVLKRRFALHEAGHPRQVRQRVCAVSTRAGIQYSRAHCDIRRASAMGVLVPLLRGDDGIWK